MVLTYIGSQEYAPHQGLGVF